MSFPRYPEYKDSGVEWLGEVPVHWEVSALKYQIRIRYGDALASEIREEGDITVFGSNGPVGLHCSANTKAPAIVLGRKGSYGKIVWAENGGFVIDTAYSIDSDTTNLNLRWVYYALQPLGLDSLSQDTGVPGLAREKAYEIRIAVAPPFEQQTIAAFLDRETAKIDALIAEQQRLIELLKEKRQAVISHAVTKGLNPNAPMKDSGIAWLGEVPAHWEVCAMRRIIRKIEQGWSPECLNRPAEPNEWGVLKSGCVNRGIFNESENKSLPENLDPLLEYEVREGDVLMSRASGSPELIGSVALVKHTRQRLMLSDKIFRVYLLQRFEPRFFVALLSSKPLRTQIEQSISGAQGLANNLAQSSIKQFSITLPPPAEQLEIVAFLDCLTTKIDVLSAEAEQAIFLLQERRTALISAAVTGKIDVRGLCA
ncbi:restriction endonuclease subunit S [Methylomonas sp. UP202]|uniref:restriction endonuclease subunit S n=1 Tax=Methylomonas sp. UP202 TaxID=3040943 RepID=UPI00247A3439|nr:restriction endonuclease subunit S [Methylomonas sp. UP202]WGS87318.1 restriction endonuclease subunit S [Methylomonas sp. UP202]